MIRFLAGLVPPLGWWGLLAIALTCAVTWHFVEVGAARREGRDEVRKEWDAEKAAALEAKREEDRMKRAANQGVTDGYRHQARAAVAAADAAAAERDGLLAELARRGAARDSAAASGADDGAAVAERALGECSSEYEAMARTTGALAAQVRGLQDYARRVCMNTDNPTPKDPKP